jgi:hypothetical protein
VIAAVAVVVPARDERRRIRDCLRSLGHALRQLPPGIERVVCVVADRCTDDTAALANAGFGGWPSARVVENRLDRTIGEVRDLGVRHVGAVLAHHPPSRVLLLSTDADTTVALDWAGQHVRLAGRGLHAVAGPADLDDLRALEPVVAARYGDVLTRARRPDGHGNVYAANLGVRADAYRAVGGFGAVASGEDHDLWRRLGLAGYRRRYADGPKVTTSARREGRAAGGLADLLRSLQQPMSPAVTSEGSPGR